jgi:HNH endonuclease
MIVLDQNILKRFLKYDPLSGIFIWKYRLAGKNLIGTEAGTLNSRGYLQIKILNRRYLSHRLAFLYMTGKWPKLEVDHKNNIKTDNSWDNLREATCHQNHIHHYRSIWIEDLFA